MSCITDFSLALIGLEAWPGYEELSRLTLTRRTLKCGRARPRDWNTNRKGPIYEQACRWINGTNKGRKVSQRVFAIQPKLCSLFQEHPFTSRDEGLTLVTSASWSCSSGNLALLNSFDYKISMKVSRPQSWQMESRNSGPVFTTAVVSLNILESGLFADFV